MPSDRLTDGRFRSWAHIGSCHYCENLSESHERRSVACPNFFDPTFVKTLKSLSPKSLKCAAVMTPSGTMRRTDAGRSPRGSATCQLGSDSRRFKILSPVPATLCDALAFTELRKSKPIEIGLKPNVKNHRICLCHLDNVLGFRAVARRLDGRHCEWRSDRKN
jgi:hypothetical protein